MNTLTRSDDVLLDALDAHGHDLVEALESMWELRPNHFAPTRVTYLRENDDIVEINFKRMKLTDDALCRLNHLASLKRLKIHGDGITDAGLADLLPLQNLEELNLGRTQITDKGVALLKDLPHLRRLDVSATAITDEAVAHIAQIRNLECLYLNFCRELGDWSIAPLLDLEHLRLLHVHGTRVTSAGAEDFAAALPGCEVVR